MSDPCAKLPFFFVFWHVLCANLPAHDKTSSAAVGQRFGVVQKVFCLIVRVLYPQAGQTVGFWTPRWWRSLKSGFIYDCSFCKVGFSDLREKNRGSR